jgi:hypothetical protein
MFPVRYEMNSYILRRRNKYGKNSVGKDGAGACEDRKCGSISLPTTEPRILRPASVTYFYKRSTFHDVNTETILTVYETRFSDLLSDRNFERRESRRLLVGVRNCFLLESVT